MRRPPTFILIAPFDVTSPGQYTYRACPYSTAGPEVVSCCRYLGAQSQAYARGPLLGGFSYLVVAASAHPVLVIAAPGLGRTVGLDRRADELPDVAREIGDAERAIGDRVRSRRIEAERQRFLTVREVKVGVARFEAVAMRIDPLVCPSGSTLPFAVGAQPRTRDAIGRR